MTSRLFHQLGHRGGDLLLSNDDIANQSRLLLNHFICNQMKKDGVEDITTEAQLQDVGSSSTKFQLPYVTQIGRALECVGDEIAKREYREKMSKIPAKEKSNVLLKVIKGVFEDGIITWGKIALLFYFAYDVCVKASGEIGLIRSLINLFVDFMKENIVEWVKKQGGWDAVRSALGSTYWQMGLVMSSGLMVSAGIYLYKNLA